MSTTLQPTWTAPNGTGLEFLLHAELDLRVALTGRPGLPGSWKVSFAVATPEFATGFKTWQDNLHSCDDGHAALQELVDFALFHGCEHLK